MSSDSAPTDHTHTHSHGHGHGLGGGWSAWITDRALRAVLVAIAFAAVATVVGVAALWPTGDGRRTAIENADRIGLGTERLSATVERITEQACSYSTPQDPQQCHVLTLTLTSGSEAGAIVALPELNTTIDRSVPRLEIGDRIVVGHEESNDYFFYADRDRRGSLFWLAALFAVVVIALGRIRGLLALVAMAATLVVLVAFVAPSVLDGHDPLLVAVVAASVIAFISLYLTHGFSPTTTVALAGTLISLGLTLALSWVFFEFANFTGFATEDGMVLPFIAENLDLSALLLGGAVIGALGAVDDVTVTQVATVAELRFRNPALTTAELFASGIRVGREHIASTVNTLLLAYAGASLPLLLLFAASDQSLDMVANSELIAVEIVRTLCGSIGLVAAVPVTTALAAMVTSGAKSPTNLTVTPRDRGAVDTDAVDADAIAPASWDDFAPRDHLD